MAKSQHLAGKTTSAQRMREATHQRREQQKQELYQEILAAAAELFLEQGYERFSLRQVAERIGYAAGTIYLYFKDKDEVLYKLTQDFYTRFDQQQELARKSESEPLARIRAMGRAYVDFGINNPVAYQLMFTQRPELLTQIIKDANEPSEGEEPGLLLEEVRCGMQIGVVRQGDPTAIADALWASVHGIVAFSLPLHDQERAEKMADTALQILIDGLKPR